MKYLKSFKEIKSIITHKAWAGQKYLVKFPDGVVREIETDDESIERAHTELFDQTKKIPSKDEVLMKAWEYYKEKNKNLSDKAMYYTMKRLSPGSLEAEKVCLKCLAREGEVMEIDPPLQIGTEIPARMHKHCRCIWKVMQEI